MSRESAGDISCQYVKGVGPRRALLLKRLGIETVLDLFYLLPRRYEDRRSFTPIRRLHVDEFQTIQGKVVALGVKETRRRFRIFQLAVEDPTGVLFATWFNQPYLKNRFKMGDTVILSGKVQWYGRELQMMSPDYEVLEGDSTDLLHTGRIVPIYPLTEGLGQRMMRMIMKHAFDHYQSHLEDALPSLLLHENRLVSLGQAVEAVHFPESFEGIAAARYRLTFEEFLILQLGIGIKRRDHQQVRRAFTYENVEAGLQEFISKLPFHLISCQERALMEISQDLRQKNPMNRLLQGDVGSGKTVVACGALHVAVKNHLQGVLLVPTEVLAQQHFKTLQRFFEPWQIEVGLLVGDEKPKVKKEIVNKLREGKIQILVGTHAILEEGVVFNKLGMVVIDEQHKFGVLQRALIRSKGVRTDVLVMTATPIPRTLALTVYGDLDVSILDAMPPGRGKISTYWIKKIKLNDAYQFIQREVKKGAQAFIIYPLVEESEKSELKAATQMFKQLSEEVFRECRMGLVHGRMKAEEKNDALYQFRDHKIDILVSTTVIEVGIDIPNANIILIENAHAFGLAQLHQLRGRIGRGPQKSYCILEGDPNTEEGISRLKTMAETLDGFKLAEADLSIRGPGEFLGTRQHGLPEIRFGNLITDLELIKVTRKIADTILAEDPSLSLPPHRKLVQQVNKRFLQRAEYLNIG